VARKPKRRQQPQRARRPVGTSGAGTTTVTTGAAGSARTATANPRVGGDQAMVRSVEMSLAPSQPARRGARVVLENADPAIPLDRVPYFVSDLMRLGVVAACMVVLLVLGAIFVIPRFVA
jgi:hypothetical protein